MLSQLHSSQYSQRTLIITECHNFHPQRVLLLMTGVNVLSELSPPFISRFWDTFYQFSFYLIYIYIHMCVCVSVWKHLLSKVQHSLRAKLTRVQVVTCRSYLISFIIFCVYILCLYFVFKNKVYLECEIILRWVCLYIRSRFIF